MSQAREAQGTGKASRRNSEIIVAILFVLFPRFLRF